MIEKQRMRHCFFWMLAAVICLIFAAESRVSAAPKSYQIRIGKEAFTEEQTRIWDKDHKGYADYDPNTQTVTFTGFEGVASDNLYVSDKTSYQMYIGFEGELTIKGDAKLCTKGADYAIRTGLPCKLTIDDGADIQTAGADNAIYVNSTLTVKGKLSAVCDSKDRARAIYAGSLSVAEQGELSSTVNAINGYAIQTGNGMEILGSVKAFVNADASAGAPEDESVALLNAGPGSILTLGQGSSVIAEASGRNGIGIKSNGYVKLGNCDLKASGTKVAIYADHATGIMLYGGPYFKTPAIGEGLVDMDQILDENNEVAKQVELLSVTWYDLWVGKNRLCDKNCGEIPGIEGGSASFDPDTGILSFQGKVTGIAEYNPDNSCLIFARNMGHLTIKGEAVLANTEGKAAISVSDTILTIDGTITAKGGQYGVLAAGTSGLIIEGILIAEGSSEAGVSAPDLTVGENASLQASVKTGESGGFAITCDTMLQKGGAVNATIENVSGFAIRALDAYTIEDGTVVASSKGVSGKAIYAKQFSVNGGTVLATSENNGNRAITSTAMTINDGTITAVGDGTSSTVLTCDNTCFINGGQVEVILKNCEGKDTWAFKGGKDMIVSGGSLKIDSCCEGLVVNGVLSLWGGDVQTKAGGKWGTYVVSTLQAAAGSLDSKGNEYGIYVEYKIDVEGGILKGEGENAVFIAGTDGLELIEDTKLIEPAGGKIVVVSGMGTTDPYTHIETVTGESAKKAVIQGLQKYPIWVGQTRVTEKNQDRIECVGGYASYQPATRTLTFSKGVTGVIGYSEGAGDKSLIRSGQNLVIDGEASLQSQETDVCCIYVANEQQLTLVGNFAFSGKNAYTILSEGSISIPGSVKVSSEAGIPLKTGKDLSVTGSLTATTSTGEYGIYVQNHADLSGKVQANAGENSKYGIWAAGRITIQKDANVKAVSSSVSGIYSEDRIWIRSGTVEAEGSGGAIFAYKKLWIGDDCVIIEPSPYLFQNGEDETIYIARDVPASHIRIERAPAVTVSFDTNGFGISPENKVITVGKRVFRPADPVEQCMIFTGWYTDQACTKLYEFALPVLQDLTLYGGWKSDHRLSLIQAKQATEEEDGNIAYYVCNVCKRWFVDQDAKKPITDHSHVVIRAKGKAKDPNGSQTGNESKEDASQSGNPDKDPKVGETIKDSVSGAKYVVTSTALGKLTVTYVAPLKSGIVSGAVPDTITINKKDYKVTGIKARAFRNCKKLKRITIGRNIRKIGKKAFYGCKSLRKITIKTTQLTPKGVGAKAFARIHPKAVAKVPKKKKTAYRKILKAKGMKKKTQKIR